MYVYSSIEDPAPESKGWKMAILAVRACVPLALWSVDEETMLKEAFFFFCSSSSNLVFPSFVYFFFYSIYFISFIPLLNRYVYVI